MYRVARERERRNEIIAVEEEESQRLDGDWVKNRGGFGFGSGERGQVACACALLPAITRKRQFASWIKR